MRKLFLCLLALAFIGCAPVEAAHRGGAANGSSPSVTPFPLNYYQNYSAGWNHTANASIFPLAVFCQLPTSTNTSIAPTLAAAATVIKTNIFFGIDTGSGTCEWPAGIGNDSTVITSLKNNSQFLISGGDPYSNNGTQSVANAISVATSASALATFIGYSWADEPGCGTSNGQPAGSGPTYGMQSGVAEVATIAGQDGTRNILYNQTGNVAYYLISPTNECGAGPPAYVNQALAAPSFPGADQYPLTDAFIADFKCLQGSNVRVSDFGAGGVNSVSTDCLWLKGILVQNMISITSGLGTTKPTWPIGEDGSDELASQANNNFAGNTTSGNTTLVFNTSSTPNGKFTNAWVGMTVAGTGIQSSTTISSVSDATHATMSKTASSSQTATTVTVTGATNNDCVPADNICVVKGNEYRGRVDQIAAEDFVSLIAGAYGITYFCRDNATKSFCLGDSASGGSAATAAANNLTYLNGIIGTTLAPILNQAHDGICSMDNPTTYSNASSCSQSILTLATNASTCPAHAMVNPYNGKEYIFIQTMRVSPNCGSNTVTATVSGMGGNAVQCGDSRTQYDAAHAVANGTTYAISSGAFTLNDIGTGGSVSDDYNYRLFVLSTSGTPTCDVTF